MEQPDVTPSHLLAEVASWLEAMPQDKHRLVCEAPDDQVRMLLLDGAPPEMWRHTAGFTDADLRDLVRWKIRAAAPEPSPVEAVTPAPPFVVPDLVTPRQRLAGSHRAVVESIHEAFEVARSRLGEALIHRQMEAGAYRLVESSPGPGPVVQIAADGSAMSDVLDAREELESEGVRVHVIDVTSAELLYAAWTAALHDGIRTATTPAFPGALRQAFDLRVPVVTVGSGSSADLAWLGSALGAPAVCLGLDDAGDLRSAGAIVNAALAALSLEASP